VRILEGSISRLGWYDLMSFEQGDFFQKTKEKTGKKEKKNHLEAGRGENARLDPN